MWGSSNTGSGSGSCSCSVVMLLCVGCGVVVIHSQRSAALYFLLPGQIALEREQQRKEIIKRHVHLVSLHNLLYAVLSSNEWAFVFFSSVTHVSVCVDDGLAHKERQNFLVHHHFIHQRAKVRHLNVHIKRKRRKKCLVKTKEGRVVLTR